MSNDNLTFQQQSEREARFFDELYSEAGNRFNRQNYSIPEELVRQIVTPSAKPLIDREYASSLIGTLEGKDVLDYGAGDGWNTICLAKAGARVWAIDISTAGVELIRKMAKANNVSESVTADVRNCYETGFSPDSFDVIYGGGILHHLDMAAAANELSRILRPDGIGVFVEPIRETYITDYIKALVLFVTRRKPAAVTEDEQVLTLRTIETLKQSFRVVRCKQFIVLSAASALITFRRARRLLLWLDYLLMTLVPGFSRLGRSVVIEVRQPIKGRA